MRFSTAYLCSALLVAPVIAGCAGGGGTGAESALPSAAHRSTAATTLGGSSFTYSTKPQVRFIGPNLLHSNCTGTCLTPDQVHTAYDFPPSIKGAGQTIVIVDPFGSPTIQSDLKQFDADNGLPDPQFTIVYPNGKPIFTPTRTDFIAFAVETSLDVEWAHAAAPSANIVLVVAFNDGAWDVEQAEAYAVHQHYGSVMSLSFGAQEPDIPGGARNPVLEQTEHVFQDARSAGMTVFASSGDLGATGGLAFPNAQYPASDPNVVAVGGTQLTLNPDGSYGSESAWDDTSGATGGAPSIIFKAPPWQAGLNGMRTTSDVAYDAAPRSGVAIYIGFAALVPGFGPNGYYQVGGTSQGPPQWAGIIAGANQARAQVGLPALGFITDQLYSLHTTFGIGLHDVTSGHNGFPAGAPGFSAGVGYDLPTGLGTPDVTDLIRNLGGCIDNDGDFDDCDSGPSQTPPPE